MFESPPFWMYILGFLLLLGPLITLHELGHYLVGRWCGVKADAFSIGFGKELFGRTDKHGTRWKVSALPLGGYVQFRGDMNPASIPDGEAIANATPEEQSGSFHHAPLGKRALIVAAGPVANILVTLAIFIGFFMLVGAPIAKDPDRQRTIAGFSEESPAREAGMKIGDIIVQIDDKPVADLREIREQVMAFPNDKVEVTVRRSGEELTFPLTIASMEIKDRFGNPMKIGLIGIEAGENELDWVKQGPLESAGLAVSETQKMLVMMVTGIKQIVTGQRSVKELGGPIKIAKYSGEQLSLGLQAFVNFAALISLNLAFINLLPIPGLDGGHLAFYAAEAVRRKPVGPRAMELAYRTGMFLVIMLMLFVTFNDLASLSLFG